MQDLLKEGERIDDLMRAGLWIIQNPQRFCFGMDAVLLAGFSKANPQDKVIDLGTGNGIIPFLLYGRYKVESIVGIDIQSENIDLANRSLQLNHLEKYISFQEMNIKDALFKFEKSSFDVVVSNPPYIAGGKGLVNETSSKAVARHEIFCNLSDVIQSAAGLLKPGGKFYMVHKPFRIDEILILMNEYKVPVKRMKLVHPFLDREPNMILVEGIKGSKGSVIIEKPLIVYESQGKYTREIYDIYGY